VVPTTKATIPSLSLFTDPEFANPGDLFSLKLAIERVTMEGYKVVLAINLPEGFSLQDTSEDIFDGTRRTLNQEATALSDHLGSTSLVTTDTGSLVMEAR
jgi:hypothetical protein